MTKWLFWFVFNLMDTEEYTTATVWLLPTCAGKVEAKFVTYLL